MYDYHKVLKKDIRNFIRDYEYDISGNKEDVMNDLTDVLWAEDSVTGNGLMGYIENEVLLSNDKAKMYVLDNIEIMLEAVQEFGCKEKVVPKMMAGDWRWFDITIRCYLLNTCIAEVLENIFKRKK